jgi:hypothetical protein
MKRPSWLTHALSIGILCLSGCASIDVAQFYRELDPVFAGKLAKCDGGRKVVVAPAADRSAMIALIPTSLKEDKAFGALTASFEATARTAESKRSTRAMNERTPEPTTETKLSASDFKNFIKAFSEANLSPSANIEDDSIRKSEGTGGPSDLFRTYYSAFIKGEFVDRFGTKLSKPEIKGSIGNDVITATLTVFLEAVADSQLRTPLIYKLNEKKERVYLTSPKAKPTSAGHVEEILMLTPEQSEMCGITEKEAGVITYLSNLAADKSALVNGVIFESFGGMELSLVIGGRFSIGDNKTLAGVVKTFVETASRRGSERLAYDFLHEYGYPRGGSSRSVDGRTAPDEGMQSLIRKF